MTALDFTVKTGVDHNGVKYSYAPLDKAGKLIKILYEDGRCVMAVAKEPEKK